MEYILASNSPRRQELLKRILPAFAICPADIDETGEIGLSPEALAKSLAEKKATAVGARFPHSIIIGSDTIVALDGEIFGKPSDREDAKRMLRLLSGREHQVITGVSLCFGKKVHTFCQTTQVGFYPLEDRILEWYLDTGEYADKAGGYGIQGYGAVLTNGIKGDFFNVVGLPLAALSRALNRFLQEICI